MPTKPVYEYEGKPVGRIWWKPTIEVIIMLAMFAAFFLFSMWWGAREGQQSQKVQADQQAVMFRLQETNDKLQAK